jgi:hypothetical protein
MLTMVSAARDTCGCQPVISLNVAGVGDSSGVSEQDAVVPQVRVIEWVEGAAGGGRETSIQLSLGAGVAIGDVVSARRDGEGGAALAASDCAIMATQAAGSPSMSCQPCRAAARPRLVMLSSRSWAQPRQRMTECPPRFVNKRAACSAASADAVSAAGVAGDPAEGLQAAAVREGA